MSYVAMAKSICEVCNCTYENGDILLHKNLRDIKPDETVTGYGLCEEYLKLFNDGFIAMVEIDNSRSTTLPNGNISREGAWRTGRLMHVRRTAASHIFNTELSADLKVSFIDIEAFNKVAQMYAEQIQGRDNHDETKEI